MRKLNTTHSRESFNPYEESSIQEAKANNQASLNGMNQQNAGSNIQLQNSQHCSSFRRKASIASG